MKKPLLVFACLFMAFSSAGIAQSQIVRENSESISLLMKYDGGGTSQGILNNIIFRLSQGNKTDVRKTEFVFITEEYSRLTLTGASTLNVYFAYKNMRLSGTTQYRGFDMGPYIVPTGVTANIQRSKNGVKLESQGVTDVNLKGNPAVFAEYSVQDTNPDVKNNEFKVILRDFVYDRGALQRFEARCDVIDSYFNANNELEVIYTDLKAINPSDLDGLKGQKAQLAGIQQRILDINNRQYEKELGVSPSLDPAKFLAKLNEVTQFATQIENDLAQTQAELPARYHARGMDHIRAGRINPGVADFNKAISLDANFAPSHYQLARMDYEGGRVREAQTRAEDVILKMNPDAQTRGLAVMLLENIANAYVNSAMAANKKQNYDAAISSLNEASGIAQRIPELNASGVLNREYSIAFNGIYNQYLAAGENALAQGQLAAAETEAVRATQFQAQHPDMLAPEPTQNLMVRVKQAQYADHVRVGREALDLQRYGEAVTRLEAAMSLEGQYGIPVDSMLPDQVQNAARPLILDAARTGTSLALKNNLPEARKYADKVRADREKYGLQNDPELDAAMQELNQRIFNQECVNAQNEFNNMVAEGKAKAKAQQYLVADQVYDNALAFLASNSECGISDQSARIAKSEIADAVDYLKQLQVVDGQIAKGDYSFAMQNYEAAASFASLKHLERYPLAHTPLIEFTKKHQNSNWVYYVAIQFGKQANFENSLDLTAELVKRGYAKKKMKAHMMLLGSEMATRDHAISAAGDPVLKALGYTQGNGKLKKFVKAYKKQWKSL